MNTLTLKMKKGLMQDGSMKIYYIEENNRKFISLIPSVDYAGPIGLGYWAKKLELKETDFIRYRPDGRKYTSCREKYIL